MELKQRLENYRANVTQIKSLERRIDSIRRSFLHNVIQESSKQAPYNLKSTVIAGYEENEMTKKQAQQRIDRCSSRIAYLSQDIDELDEIVSHIPDRQVQTAIMLYYLEGMTWQQVAFKMGGSSESTFRKIVENFFKSFPKNPNS